MKQIECPYCHNYKIYEYPKEAMGEIHGSGWNKIGLFRFSSKKCGNCENYFSRFSQYNDKKKEYDTFIKYNEKGIMKKNGWQETSYDRMEIKK